MWTFLIYMRRILKHVLEAECPLLFSVRQLCCVDSKREEAEWNWEEGWKCSQRNASIVGHRFRQV